jgi:hypothetical protein
MVGFGFMVTVPLAGLQPAPEGRPRDQAPVERTAAGAGIGAADGSRERTRRTTMRASVGALAASARIHDQADPC